MTKFANRQRTDTQTSVSKTESTLILSGSSTDTRGSWPIVLHCVYPCNLRVLTSPYKLLKVLGVFSDVLGDVKCYESVTVDSETKKVILNE